MKLEPPIIDPILHATLARIPNHNHEEESNTHQHPQRQKHRQEANQARQPPLPDLSARPRRLGHLRDDCARVRIGRHAIRVALVLHVLDGFLERQIQRGRGGVEAVVEEIAAHEAGDDLDDFDVEGLEFLG